MLFALLTLELSTAANIIFSVSIVEMTVDRARINLVKHFSFFAQEWRKLTSCVTFSEIFPDSKVHVLNYRMYQTKNCSHSVYADTPMSLSSNGVACKMCVQQIVLCLAYKNDS